MHKQARTPPEDDQGTQHHVTQQHHDERQHDDHDSVLGSRTSRAVRPPPANAPNLPTLS